jgi:hypothetical protein
MSICYQCGNSIPSNQFPFRRKVMTGEWLRRGYSNGKVSSVNLHYGLRLVCKSCAFSIDREARARELMQWSKLALVVAVLLVVLLLRLLN